MTYGSNSNCYSIDKNDLIVSVEGQRNNSAIENDGLVAVADRVIGRSLWEYLHGDLVKDIYGKIITTIRTGEAASTTLNELAFRRRTLAGLRPLKRTFNYV